MSCHCSPYVHEPVSQVIAAKARTESSAELAFRLALRVRVWASKEVLRRGLLGKRG
jgi:hypothetical protein